MGHTHTHGEFSVRMCSRYAPDGKTTRGTAAEHDATSGWSRISRYADDTSELFQLSQIGIILHSGISCLNPSPSRWRTWTDGEVFSPCLSVFAAAVLTGILPLWLKSEGGETDLLN